MIMKTPPMSTSALRMSLRRRLDRGFSLVEVMVALVVCSIGLLGLAKMESLALSSTGVAGNRSIAALQASSLASAMHANRAYWGAGLAPAAVTVTVSNTGAWVISDPNLSAVPPQPCNTPGAGACTMDQMAAFDMQNWATALAALMKNSIATISCATTGTVSCNIQIQWTENAVSSNSAQTQAQLSAMITNNSPTYVLYVQP
jgi:type IV pilus assembly protein PilV